MTTKRTKPEKDQPSSDQPKGDPDAPLTDSEGNVSPEAAESLENARRNAGIPVTSGDLDPDQQ